MILLKKILLAFFGLCAGGIIAAGVYAFLAIIGIFVRLMGKTGTRKHIMLYETIIILGGVLGNILDIYEFPIYMGAFFGHVFLIIAGLSMGYSWAAWSCPWQRHLRPCLLSAGGSIWRWAFNT